MIDALRRHWPEYLAEAFSLGLFMVAAASFGVWLFASGSAVVRAIPDELPRRALMGLAMGATAVGLIHSPWGRRSGAHMNPAVTFAFWRLRKIAGRDAAFYALFQFLGGVAGLALSAWAWRGALAEPAVNYVVTVPGPWGVAAAFVAETAISAVLMAVVLVVSNTPRWERHTALFAGALVALYIAFEAPVSGMSMNPARTFGSALPSGVWTAFWVYLAAPPLGMLLAAEAFVAARGARAVHCAKLHHANPHRCIFRCDYHSLARSQ